MDKKNNNSILKMLENSITDEQRKLFEDSFIRMVEDGSKRKRHIIAYLYLWVSVMENITLREAFERYSWIETPCKRDTIYHITNMYTVLEKFEAPYRESVITLIPRSHPSECKMPYQEAALEMVELFKEILHIP
jgi:hypothetical protein